ncbi:DUF3240 family protein [Colwellia sp. MEBiC06753]
MPESMVLFTLISPTPLKDELTDHLLSYPDISGFNLKPICGYSKEHSAFNIEEQVRGYQDMVQFEVLIAQDKLDALKTSLAVVCQSLHLKYWCTPVIATGHL